MPATPTPTPPPPAPAPPLDRCITIHGHFYQPPRENPWLEAVETQDSAHPYHDWNERITEECYGPNASARILDSHDRIQRIANNYASISFNFGPTLLSWLEVNAADTYAAILDADRQSRERYSGHGSAIAQAYNHVILPLANARDQRTQVRWGVRDFESRFGRKPEGMWLPETAVDVDSLEALAAEGIAFTILEPHQAARFRTIGETEWTSVNGGLDPTRVYRCPLPSGRSIDLFFYDGPISRAVAFENLLARGEHLAYRLASAISDVRQHSQNVNIATDGETYGHHHRYGDMALAYALRLIEERKLARLTNYGEFRRLHPPTHEVEIVERTAWSCGHGVERWRSDCGCSGGGGVGWNQRWRAPLRESLDWLRDRVAVIFENVAAPLLRDPWLARDDYIEVVLDRSDESIGRFLGRNALPNAASEPGSVTRILQLMELQRNAMLMYTSCGWFFSDVSGIETVQVLQYAGRVIQLAEQLAGERLEPEFLTRVGAAHSNVSAHGTAAQIYERQVRHTRLDLARVAAHYAVASLFDSFGDDAKLYCYTVHQHDFTVHKTGRARMAVGSITVTSTITRESESFEFAVLHLGETELTGGVRRATTPDAYSELRAQLTEALQPGGIPTVIRSIDQQLSEAPLSIRSLFRDEQRRILNLLCNATLEEAESAFRQLHERYDPLMRFHTSLGIPLPKVLQTAAEFDVNLQLRRLLAEVAPPITEIAANLREAREERVALDETTLLTMKSAVERAARRFREVPDDIDRLELFESIVRLVRVMQLDVDLRKAQNEVYAMRSAARPIIVANGSPEAQRWIDVFDALTDELAISRE